MGYQRRRELHDNRLGFPAMRILLMKLDMFASLKRNLETVEKVVIQSERQSGVEIQVGVIQLEKGDRGGHGWQRFVHSLDQIGFQAGIT